MVKFKIKVQVIFFIYFLFSCQFKNEPKEDIRKTEYKDVKSLPIINNVSTEKISDKCTSRLKNSGKTFNQIVKKENDIKKTSDSSEKQSYKKQKSKYNEEKNFKSKSKFDNILINSKKDDGSKCKNKLKIKEKKRSILKNKKNKNEHKIDYDNMSEKELIEEFKNHLIKSEEARLQAQKDLKRFAKLNYLSTIGLTVGVIGVLIAATTSLSVIVGLIISLIGYSAYLTYNIIVNYIYYKKLSKIHEGQNKKRFSIFNRN